MVFISLFFFVWGHVLPRHDFVYFVVEVDAIYVNVDVAEGGPSLPILAQHDVVDVAAIDDDAVVAEGGSSLLILTHHDVVDVAGIDGDVVVAESGPRLLILPRHGQHQRCHLPLKGEDTKG